MIELPVLEAFDALLWLRAAEQVERRYGTTEATTSRYRKRCLQLFGLAMERRQGEWELHRRYLPMVQNHGDVAFDPGFLSRVGL